MGFHLLSLRKTFNTEGTGVHRIELRFRFMLLRRNPRTGLAFRKPGPGAVLRALVLWLNAARWRLRYFPWWGFDVRIRGLLCSGNCGPWRQALRGASLL